MHQVSISNLYNHVQEIEVYLLPSSFLPFVWKRNKEDTQILARRLPTNGNTGEISISSRMELPPGLPMVEDIGCWYKTEKR